MIMTAAITSSVISGIIAIAVAVFAARQNTKSQTAQLELQVQLQQDKLKTELRTEFMAESAIRQLLTEAQPKRSWEEIRKRIGGFSDEELRKLLVRSGAVRYEVRGTKKELWGLIDRNEA